MRNDGIGGGAVPIGVGGNVFVLERPGSVSSISRVGTPPGVSAGREGGAVDEGVRAVFTAHAEGLLPAEIEALAHMLARALANRRPR